nr:hypothetical protein [Roseivivax lentus]
MPEFSWLQNLQYFAAVHPSLLTASTKSAAFHYDLISKPTDRFSCQVARRPFSIRRNVTVLVEIRPNSADGTAIILKMPG